MRAWLACILLATAVLVRPVAGTARDAYLPVRQDAGTALAQAISRRAAADDAEVGVAIHALDGSLAVGVNPETPFHAASTMKVPVMVELFGQAEAGRLSLDDTLEVTDTFRSIVDGSPYTLDAADDSDPALYAALGQHRTLRALCESMIVVSSNLATNLLIDRLGVDNVRATVGRLGADGIDVRRGVEDNKAFEAGRNNTTTASGLASLLTALARGQAAPPGATADMIAMLERQQFNEGLPAGLPPGTRVAHKTGHITRIHHDAGIVFGPTPYVIVVLVRGLDDEQRSAALIADISRMAWQALQAR